MSPCGPSYRSSHQAAGRVLLVAGGRGAIRSACSGPALERASDFAGRDRLANRNNHQRSMDPSTGGSVAWAVAGSLHMWLCAAARRPAAPPRRPGTCGGPVRCANRCGHQPPRRLARCGLPHHQGYACGAAGADRGFSRRPPPHDCPRHQSDVLLLSGWLGSRLLHVEGGACGDRPGVEPPTMSRMAGSSCRQERASMTTYSSRAGAASCSRRGSVDVRSSSGRVVGASSSPQRERVRSENGLRIDDHA